MAALTAGPFTENVGLTDNVAATDAKFMTEGRPFAGATPEIVSTQLAIVRIFTDSVQPATAESVPTPTVVVGGPTFTRNPTEQMSITDQGVRFDTVDTYVDNIAIGENYTTSSNTVRTFTEQMTVTETIATSANITLTFTEIEKITDVPTYTFNTSPSKIINETVSITESVTPTLTSTIIPQNFVQTMNETMTVSESIQLLFNVDPLHATTLTLVNVAGFWKQTSWALNTAGIWVYPPVWVKTGGFWVQIQ
jgi:hypothetical protein